MNKLLGSLALSLIAPALVGQCIPGTGTSFGNGDDFMANGGVGIDMGFAFPFAGSTFQFVHPSSNGFAFLSDGTPTLTGSDFSATVGEFDTLEPRIAPFWTDINMQAVNGADLRVDTSVAGVCTITWVNATLYLGTDIFEFSVTLDATGNIEFDYDANALHTNDLIVGMSPGFGVGSPAASEDLSAFLPIATDMAYELFLPGTFDLAGTGLLMIPTVPGFVPVPSTALPCASKLTYGVGCVDVRDAAFEIFDTGTQDIGLTGTAITFLRSGSDYSILDAIPGTFVAPTAAAVVVSALDDAFGAVALSTPMPTSQGTTSTLNVHTNGFVVLSANAPTIGQSWIPTAEKFNAFVDPTICEPWYDWSPNAGGQVVSEEIAGIMYITYDAVQPFLQTTTDTFQYQFELATGNCTIVYENMTYGGAAVHHTPTFGYTNGNPMNSADVDMSAELASVLTIADLAVAPLSVDSNLPILGTNWNINTTNIDAVSPVAITFFGDAQPAVTLPLSAIGFLAPGCDINVNTILASITSVAVAGSATATIPLPANPALAGGVLTAQSICLTLANPANLLTSNGVMGTLGN